MWVGDCRDRLAMLYLCGYIYDRVLVMTMVMTGVVNDDDDGEIDGRVVSR